MKTLLIASLAAMLCGCATGVTKSSYDKFTDTTINSTFGNEIVGSVLDPGTYVELNMRQEIKPDSTNHFLVLETRFIPGFGSSLKVLADNQRYEFERSIFSGQQGLKVFYAATPEQLRGIAMSTNAEMRIINIYGNPLDRKLSRSNLTNYQDFVQRYLK